MTSRQFLRRCNTVADSRAPYLVRIYKKKSTKHHGRTLNLIYCAMAEAYCLFKADTFY